jgi:uncharacterized membrane protein
VRLDFFPDNLIRLAVKLQSSFKFKGGFVPEETLATGLSENAASGLAYITFIPAIVLLTTAPYSQNLTVRFHAWQSIFLNIVVIAVFLGLYVLGMIPIIYVLDVVLTPAMAIGFLVLWIALLINTFNGRRARLPYLADLAEQQANPTRF